MNQALKPEADAEVQASGDSGPGVSPGGNYRWVICGLLLFSTTVNYMDRQVISYLKEPVFCLPADQGGFGWSNSDFANVTAFFTGFYAGMTILAGWVIDKIGTKLGLALSLITWSVFGMANAFAGRFTDAHVAIRSAFGIGEAGNFPASIKTVAEWFPKRERALATGVFNSGSNIGAMISALFVPWCLSQFGDQLGWKMAYILTGAIGFVWLIFWYWLYDTPAKQKRLSPAEFAYIHSDQDEAKPGATGPRKQEAFSFRKFFSFEGRIPQNAYFGTTVMIVILWLFVFFVTRLTANPDAQGIKMFLGVAGFFAIWASVNLQVKRWHDLEKSAWPSALCVLSMIATALLLPIFGLYHGGGQWWLILAVSLPAVVLHGVLSFRQGDVGTNKFGQAGKSGLLGYRQTWSFFAGKFFTDGVWWFYLFWLPDYLHKQFGMDKAAIRMPTFIVYGVGIVGSVFGGRLPMTFMNRGMPVYRARMTAMFVLATIPLVVLTTQFFGNVERFGKMAAVLAVATICIGAAAHQAWSANLFTTVSDMFPKKSVGSVTGIGAMAGGLGGVVVLKLSGALTDKFKDNPQTAYLLMFGVCALSYLVAWGFMKALVPRHRPITDL